MTRFNPRDAYAPGDPKRLAYPDDEPTGPPPGWVPPPMIETCRGCGACGDVVDGFLAGECTECDAPCCAIESRLICAGEIDHDEDGSTIWCVTCTEKGRNE